MEGIVHGSATQHSPTGSIYIPNTISVVYLLYLILSGCYRTHP